MRPLLLPLATLLACATEPAAPVAEPAAPATAPTPETEHPTPAASDTPDLGRWIEDARALDQTEDFEERQARARALTDRLEPATGWKAACGEDAPEGNLVLHPLSGGDYVAEITCFLAVYQANFTLALVSPEAATRLPLPFYDTLGEVLNPTMINFAGLLMDDDPTDRQFVVFTKYRGPGDCGEWGRYEVAADGTAEAVEVRMRDCGDDVPDELPPPETWSVVYAR